MNLKPSLLQAGYIKIGKKGREITSANNKKFRVPMKLDHFIVTTMQRDIEDNLIQDEFVMEQLKSSAGDDGGAVLDEKNSNLTAIPVRLLYDDPNENLETRYARYDGQKCICTGDGVMAVTGDSQVKCPCEKIETDYKGSNPCKAHGTLTVILDGTDLGSCYLFRTTSIYSIRSIMGGLSLLCTVTGGKLAFVPLHLAIQPKTVNINGVGNAQIYVVSVVFKGHINRLQERVLDNVRSETEYLSEVKRIGAIPLLTDGADDDEETPMEQAIRLKNEDPASFQAVCQAFSLRTGIEEPTEPEHFEWLVRRFRKLTNRRAEAPLRATGTDG